MIDNPISRNIKIMVKGKVAELDSPVFLFQGDKNIDIYVEIVDDEYTYDKTIGRFTRANLLDSYPSDVNAMIKVLKPSGQKIVIEDLPVVDKKFKFTIEEDLIDEFNEIGTHKLQVIINSKGVSQRAIPHVDFEILEPLFDVPDAIVEEALVGSSKVAKDGVRVGKTFSGKYIATEWGTGDIITAIKLNNIENGLLEMDMNIDKLIAIEQGEGARVVAEKEREASENQRVQDENQRKTNEIQREDSESTRVKAENTRTQNEENRESSETSRVDSENIRVTSENQRLQNEDDRKSSETARIEEENRRISTENTRELDETARKNNEIKRNEAETLRQNQHESREEFLNSFVSHDNEQDTRLDAIEDVNSIQSAKLNTLFNNANGDMEVESNTNNIKLDSSKRGVAKVDYIRGNTLVNNAKENRELILNDEIDVEGTNCTINETVEGGLVDVELEGLSLNNLWLDKYAALGGNVTGNNSVYESGIMKLISNGQNYVTAGQQGTKNSLLKPDTDYTLVFYIIKNTINVNQTIYLNIPYTDPDNKCAHLSNEYIQIKGSEIGTVVRKIKTLPSFDTIIASGGFFPRTQLSTSNIGELWYKCVILEGDHTNKPVPIESFTGIKSVGEEVALTPIYNEIIANKQVNSWGDIGVVRNLTVNKTYTVLIENTGEAQIDFKPSEVAQLHCKVGETIVKSFKALNDTYLLVNSIQESRTCGCKILILEGDYENANLEYFEGSIKKYKIETKSQNKNLLSNPNISENSEAILEANGDVESLRYMGQAIKVEPNTKYTFSVDLKANTNNISSADLFVLEYPQLNTNFYRAPYVTITNLTQEYNRYHITVVTGNKTNYINLRVDNNGSNDVNKSILAATKPSLVLGDYTGAYISPKQHKKVILLDEPLRGLPNGAKDTIIKKDGKTYVKRTFGKKLLNGVDEGWYIQENDNGTPFWQRFALEITNMDRYVDFNNPNKTLCDRLVYDSQDIKEGTVYIKLSNTLCVYNPTTKTISDFLTWIQENPLTFIYQLSVPVYEELKGIDIEYSTYSEVTNVSTNAVIPCNQNIKNTGVDCVLKPSTLYSVYDIKKGTGVAKFNLGGTISSNNKITTPVILNNNYLRIYGKGLTSKDIEVFEGDKQQTSYFGGLLNTFEDRKITQAMVDDRLEKVEDLGKYRVGLKVVGKNLWIHGDADFVTKHISWQDIKGTPGAYGNIFEKEYKYATVYLDSGYYYISHGNITNFNLVHFVSATSEEIYPKDRITFIPAGYYYFRFNPTEVGVRVTASELSIIKVSVHDNHINSTYEPYKEFKLSVLLNSPLLKGDEICVKDGVIGHYHKSSTVTLNDLSGEWVDNNTESTQTYRYMCSAVLPGAKHYQIDKSFMTCDTIPPIMWSETIAYGMSKSQETVFVNNKDCPTVESFKEWIKNNPITVVYELEEPYFEPLTTNLPRLVLDIFDNSTINVDTVIPVESKFIYTSYIPSIPSMKKSLIDIEEKNIDMVATSFDMDYRLLEIEWTLEEFIGATEINISNIIKTKGVSNMALTRYEMAKIMILGNAYDKETLTRQLTRYLEKKIITQGEYDELIALMEDKESVVGS